MGPLPPRYSAANPAGATAGNNNNTNNNNTNNTNFYISTLAGELASVCWQHSTNTGNLSTGGLGAWTWLQYQSSFHCGDGNGERLSKLRAARDAAYEALDHNMSRRAGGSSGGDVGGVGAAAAVAATATAAAAGDDSFFDDMDDEDDMLQLHQSSHRYRSTQTQQPPFLAFPSMSVHTNPYLGCHTMLAVILYQLGEDTAMVQHHVHRVLQCIRRTLLLLRENGSGGAGGHGEYDSRCDVWFGRAGAMQTIFFLRQHLRQDSLGQALVVTLARQVLSEGRRVALRVHREWMAVQHNDALDYSAAGASAGGAGSYSPSSKNVPSLALPLLWEYQGTVYLGWMHGVVGICTTLLGLSNDEWELIEQHSAAHDYTHIYSLSNSNNDDEVPSLVNSRQLLKQTIDGLQRHCFVSGNLRKSLHGVLNEVDQDQSWSHGAAGYVMLLLRSHEVFGSTAATPKGGEEDSHYLVQAQRLAEQVLWARRLLLTKRGGGGIGLTTGMTGVAYVFVRLAQVLMRADMQKESLIWKQRAEQLARHGVNHWRELLVMSSYTSHPYSVMEGLGGLVSLLLDLNCIEEAQFPFSYQPETVTSMTIDLWRTEQRQTYTHAPNHRPPHPANAEPRKLTGQPQPNIPKSAKGIAVSSIKHKTNLLTIDDPGISLGSTSTKARITSSIDKEERTTAARMSDRGSNREPECDVAMQTEDPDQTFLMIQDSIELSFPGEAQGVTTSFHQFEEEKHSAVGMVKTIAKESQDDTQEFQCASQNEVADIAYLRMQESNDGFQYEYEGATTNPPLLDEENHKAVVDAMIDISKELQDDSQEFQCASQNESADIAYLRMQESNDGFQYEYGGATTNPLLLDEENHKNLVNAAIENDNQDGMSAYQNPNRPRNRTIATIGSNAVHAGVARVHVNEFAESKEQDDPVASYLRMQDSSDDLYFEYGVLRNPSVLDDETHSPQKDEERGIRLDLKEPLSAQESYEPAHTMDSSGVASDASANDDDEFQLPDDQDKPDRHYMRRQDSSDKEYFAYSNDINKNPMLDEEEHSGHLSTFVAPETPDDLIHANNEEGEFEAADRGDQPDEEYLRMQGSTDEIAMPVANGHHAIGSSSLDEDQHATIGMDLLVKQSSGEEYAKDFQDPDETDEPDKRYLSKQDSQDDMYYEYSTDQEVLAVAKADMRLLAMEAAEAATKRSPPRKGKKIHFEKKTPPRYQRSEQQGVVTPATTATTAMSTTPHSISSLSRAAVKNILPQLHSELAEACLKEAEGEGNILNGGLGVSVFLRIKLSEFENEAIKSKEYLQAALKYALTAAEDALAETNGRLYPSILSSDLIGAQCLLVSLLYRLGRRKDACRLANATITKLAELYEIDTKQDCSVIFGLAGALQAIWFLRKELDDKMLGRDYVLTASSAILTEGKKHEGKYGTDTSLMWEWHERPFLGAGTGATGVLYSLLGHSDEEWICLNDCLPQAKNVIRETIDRLGDLKHPSGNLMAAIDGFDEDRSTDWTHGAPGYCLLLLRAFEVFNDEKYFAQAQQLAENVIWPRRMQRRGLGLARGVSGIAYVFMAMARVDTGNSELWRLRAAKMADMAITDLKELKAMSKHPNSLFEGLGGLVSLLIDLERPTSAVHFPFFEHQVMNENEQPIGTATTVPDAAGDSTEDQGNNDGSDGGRDQSKPDSTGMLQPNKDQVSSPPPRRNDHASGNPKKSNSGISGGQPIDAGLETCTAATAPTSAGSTSTSRGRNSQQYETPPRALTSDEGGPMRVDAVSPMTEPSPGILPARSSCPQTSPAQAGLADRHVQINRQRHPTRETQISGTATAAHRLEDEYLLPMAKRLLVVPRQQHQQQSYRPPPDAGGHNDGVVQPKHRSPKVWPPQIKRHMYTHPDDVPLAERATISWRAKIQDDDAHDRSRPHHHHHHHHDDGDAFTSGSIERLQRAEASWFKRKTMLIHKSGNDYGCCVRGDNVGADPGSNNSSGGGASVGSNGSGSFRRLVGGFQGC